MRKLLTMTLLTFTIFTLYAPTSIAEDKHKHETHKPKKSGHDDHGPAYGSQFFEDKNHHGVEMVFKEKEIIFYMTANGKPLDMTGTKFKAIIQTDAGNKVLNLTPEKNTLKATLEAALPKGSKIAVTGKDSHGDVLQARFIKK